MRKRTKLAIVVVGAALLAVTYLRFWGPATTRDWAEKKWCNTLGLGKYTGSWSGKERPGPFIDLRSMGMVDARVFARDMIRIDKVQILTSVPGLLEEDPQFVAGYYPIPARAIESRGHREYMAGFRIGIRAAIEDWAHGRLGPYTEIEGR